MSEALRTWRNDVPCSWCPGCGNFALLDAVARALEALRLAPRQVLVCSGIGQAAKTPHYLRANMFNGLHGRALPVAQAAKLAADDLTVLVHAGDGDAYGEGGNHLLHAIRRNVDVTLVVHDNRIYGLTKGQASPTTPAGQRTPVDPKGVLAAPLDPLALAVALDCSFVAQGFTGQVEQLADLLAQAVRHPGFALVNVLQPCVSFNKVHTHRWFKDHALDVPADHDPADRLAALALLSRLHAEDRLPLGLVYRRSGPTYDQAALAGVPHPLRDRSVEPGRVARLLERFR